MSCRILVIPEDPTYNGAILKPLIERMAAECGKPNARVTVLTNPAIKGIDDLRGAHLLCCAAVQEVEAWLLAGHIEKLPDSWSQIRANTSVKEQVFQPFLERHGDAKRPSGGRDLLMKTALQNFSGLLARCPELSQLQSELCQSLPN